MGKKFVSHNSIKLFCGLLSSILIGFWLSYLTISSRLPWCSLWVSILNLRRVISVSRLLAVRRTSSFSEQIFLALAIDSWTINNLLMGINAVLWHLLPSSHRMNCFAFGVSKIFFIILPEAPFPCQQRCSRGSVCCRDGHCVSHRNVSYDACISAPPDQSCSTLPAAGQVDSI